MSRKILATVSYNAKDMARILSWECHITVILRKLLSVFMFTISPIDEMNIVELCMGNHH